MGTARVPAGLAEAARAGPRARKIALHAYRRDWRIVSESKTGHAMVSEDFRNQVRGYGLTTAHILYRRPDHRWLLQSYVWQNYDLFPEFPELHRFLAFWQEKLEGPLHSVRVAHCKLIKPAELKAIDGEFRLH
jgi:uncharacterized protein Usg